jgi:pyruvate dehydrogenase E2 component (dihydrolipoamide acetyltransferase)
MSSFQLRLPDLGEGVAEGTVDSWLVSQGEKVQEDQLLVEVTTDKTTVEIPSPVAGLLQAILVPAGETVQVGTVLAEIETGTATDESPSSHIESPGQEQPMQDRATQGNPVPSGLARATPGARKLARELGVDLEEVARRIGSGVVREQDIRAAAQPSTAAPGSGPGEWTSSQEGVLDNSLPRHGAGDRKTIAERLSRAALIPTVTNVDEVDFEAVMASGVSPLVALCAVVVASLPQHPKLNGWCQDGKLIPQSKIHLGIATQTKAGLVVPVIRDAQDMGVEELAFGIRDVTFRAKEGRLRPEELSGSTFTVTSAGKLAGLWSTPLLNPPEVAILGLYRIEPRAVVTEKGIEAKRRANLSITFDHRVLDGLDAASFLAFVKQGLEDFGSQEGIKDRDQPGSAGPVGD